MLGSCWRGSDTEGDKAMRDVMGEAATIEVDQQTLFV